MFLTVNGKQQECDVSVSLKQFLEENGIKKEAVVCEINKQVIEKGLYSDTFLKEEDVLEIVQFVGGG